jgi:hypothetical protein
MRSLQCGLLLWLRAARRAFAIDASDEPANLLTRDHREAVANLLND